MPKYNDFDLDLNVEKVNVEETNNAMWVKTQGPYKSCYYICLSYEDGECY